MQADYWHQLWQEGRLGFHQEDGNPKLKAHLGALGLAPGARIFLPLCGKTRDIAWLLSQGYRVVGAELSRLAIEQLFDELGVKADVSRDEQLERHSAPGADIFVGDILELQQRQLGAVDAVFDRAAIVALPENLRTRYAAHMAQITNTAPQLMMTFEYDQTLMEGPPFSVPENEVKRLHSANYGIDRLETTPVEGNLKGRIAALDHVWHLRAKHR